MSQKMRIVDHLRRRLQTERAEPPCKIMKRMLNDLQKRITTLENEVTELRLENSNLQDLYDN